MIITAQEGYMTVANELISQNQSKMFKFLDVVSTIDSVTFSSQYCPSATMEETLERILCIIFEYKNRLGQAAMKLVCDSQSYKMTTRIVLMVWLFC